jgi:F-type H+-transporting ATPase subunit delta
MLGPSRTSLVEVREILDARLAEAGQADLSAQLLEVSALLGREAHLRGALADPGAEPDRRAELARLVLGGRVEAPVVDLLGEVARRRWSGPRDLVDALETLGAEAAFAVAAGAGRLDAVEDELFRFARTVVGDVGLQSTLSDPALGTDAKVSIVGRLLEGRAAPETVLLVVHVVRHPRGRRVEEALEDLVELASQRREHVVAEVRVAARLTAEQERRLSAVLTRLYGRTVDLQVEVDPGVLGGVVVRVGDEVIDGSVAHRLAEARRSLGV